jgi:hypothetical protein
MRLPFILALGVCVVARATSVAAQFTTGEGRAFIALRSSHIGSLTPLMTPAMLNRRLDGAQLGIRYGLRDESGIHAHSIAASGIFGVGAQSSVTATAGVVDADCATCSPAMLLGIGADMRLKEVGDVIGGGSLLTIAVSGDIGYAQLKPGNDYGITLGVGAPITLSFGGATGGLRFAPFFTPIFGVGQTSTPCMVTNCEESGTRWLLGGGIGVWNRESSVAVSVGINQVVRSGAQPVYGINVLIGGR